MPRTTEALVKTIVEVDENNITSLTAFIATANALTNRVAARDSSVDATTLELIERWLSAHFYSIRDRQRSSEQEDVVQASYMGQATMMLKATLYGQQAILLDPSGYLASIDSDGNAKKRRVQVVWLGKECGG